MSETSRPAISRSRNEPSNSSPTGRPGGSSLNWRSATTSNDYGIFIAAVGALARTNTEEADLVLRKRLTVDDWRREIVVNTISRYKTKRNCDLMAELWMNPDTKDRWTVEQALTSARLDYGWPCFQSLAPYRETNPLANALWLEGYEAL